MTLEGAVYFNSSTGNGKSSPLGRRFLPQRHLKELLLAFLQFLLDLNSPQTPHATAGLIVFLPENHPLAKNCQKITSGSSRVCLSLAEHCTDLKQALRAGCSFLPPSAHFPTATVRTSRWKSLKNTVLEIPKELLRCNVKVFPFQPATSLCFTRSSQRSDLKPSQPRLSNRKTLGQ